MATPGRSPPVPAQLELKAPPYPLNALEPYMSQQTLEFHWGKHHRGYVDGLKKQVAGTDLDGLPLENVIVKSYNNGDPLPTFNNAAQIWNHDFFWESMKPGGGGQPSGTLLELIERDFGSVQALLDEFKNAALTQFGSGWAWLVYKPTDKDYKLAVERLPTLSIPWFGTTPGHSLSLMSGSMLTTWTIRIGGPTLSPPLSTSSSHGRRLVQGLMLPLPKQPRVQEETRIKQHE